MDPHSLPRQITRWCSEHVHRRCEGIGCDCVCHLKCADCGRDSDTFYDSSQVIGVQHLVCATCYVDEVKSPMRHKCENCHVNEAFCEPHVDGYLCVDCHHILEIERYRPKAAS